MTEFSNECHIPSKAQWQECESILSHGALDMLSYGYANIGHLPGDQNSLRNLGFPDVRLPNSNCFGNFDAPPTASETMTGKKAEIQAVNDHLGDLVRVASLLPPGKINVANDIALAATFGITPEKAVAALGLPIDKQTMAMLSNVESIEKTPDGHVVIKQKAETDLPLHVDKLGEHLDHVKIAKEVSFDLQPNSEHISNINGIAVEGHGGLPPRPLQSKIQDINIGKDQNGKTVVQARATNPENGFERLFTKDYQNSIAVDIQLQDDGQVVMTQHGKSSTVARL